MWRISPLFDEIGYMNHHDLRESILLYGLIKLTLNIASAWGSRYPESVEAKQKIGWKCRWWSPLFSKPIQLIGERVERMSWTETFQTLFKFPMHFQQPPQSISCNPIPMDRFLWVDQSHQFLRRAGFWSDVSGNVWSYPVHGEKSIVLTFRVSARSITFFFKRVSGIAHEKSYPVLQY